MSLSPTGFISEEPHIFYLHKNLEISANYQDAHAFDLSKNRYAIADGATKSFFAAPWANLLVKRFCDDDDSLNLELFEHQNWESWLEPIQSEWDKQIKIVAERADPSRKYYILNRYARKDPAASTFTGLQLEPSKMRWRAMIIGDSCLFHIRGQTVTSYLIKNSREFDSHPPCFASIPNYNKYTPEFIGGNLQVNDFFLLATDAFAEWVLTQCEENNWMRVWDQLKRMTWDSFFQFIQTIRSVPKKPIKDDDVTIAIIPIGHGARHQLAQSIGSPKEEQIQEDIIQEPLPSIGGAFTAFFQQNQINKPVSKTVSDAYTPTHVLPDQGIIALQQEVKDYEENKRELIKQVGQHERTLQKFERKYRLFRYALILVSTFLLFSICFNLYFWFGWSDSLFIISLTSDIPTPTPTPTPTITVSIVELSSSSTPPVVTPTENMPTLLPTPIIPTSTTTSLLPTFTPIIAPFNVVTVTSTSELVMPSSTPTGTSVFSLPSVMSLPGGTNIYYDTKQQAVIIIFASNVNVSVLETVNDAGQSKVQFDVWSISDYGNQQYSKEISGTIFIENKVSARIEPLVISETFLGEVNSGFSFPKIDEQYQDGILWYQYRIVGFVQAE